MRLPHHTGYMRMGPHKECMKHVDSMVILQCTSYSVALLAPQLGVEGSALQAVCDTASASLTWLRRQVRPMLCTPHAKANQLQRQTS